MHDFFHVLGLADMAHPLEVRRVSARYVRRCHPDFQSAPRALPTPNALCPRDAAIDYVDPAGFLERIQAAFFGTTR